MQTKKFNVWVDQMEDGAIVTRLGQSLKQLIKNQILFLKMVKFLKVVLEIIVILLKCRH